MVTADEIVSIRERTSILAVVDEALARACIPDGRVFRASPCPFCGARWVRGRVGGFCVNDDRGFFHCFDCHASGSAIDFVMRREGMSFLAAVRRLSERVQR